MIEQLNSFLPNPSVITPMSIPKNEDVKRVSRAIEGWQATKKEAELAAKESERIAALPPPDPIIVESKPSYQEGAIYRDKKTGVMRRYQQGQFV